MESSQDQVIAETAQRLRNGGDIAGAEAYLRQEINMAAERGDRVSEIVGRLWLATTLAFDERWSEGAVVAQQAHEASRYVSPSLQRAKCPYPYRCARSASMRTPDDRLNAFYWSWTLAGLTPVMRTCACSDCTWSIGGWVELKRPRRWRRNSPNGELLARDSR